MCGGFAEASYSVSISWKSSMRMRIVFGFMGSKYVAIVTTQYRRIAFLGVDCTYMGVGRRGRGPWPLDFEI